MEPYMCLWDSDQGHQAADGGLQSVAWSCVGAVGAVGEDPPCRFFYPTYVWVFGHGFGLEVTVQGLGPLPPIGIDMDIPEPRVPCKAHFSFTGQAFPESQGEGHHLGHGQLERGRSVISLSVILIAGLQHHQVEITLGTGAS